MSSPQDAPTRWALMLRHIGPGLILTASIVGSGELIVTPKLAGEAGFKLLWLIVLGCVIKVFVQIELGRYAVATGQTTLQALNTLPGPRWIVGWMVWLWLGMFIALAFQLAGIVGGIAEVFTAAGIPWDKRLLAVGVGASCAWMLSAGRYRLVENVSTAMVVAFTGATLVAVGSLQWSPYAITTAQVASGFTFSLPKDFMTAFAAFAVIGVGASELFYYPYWCLEKGYATHVGADNGTAVWAARAKGWMRIMRLDAWISMVVYTTATVAFYLLGAAVLHAKGLKVTDAGLIETLAHMYRESFGSWSLYAFLVGAFFVLYSTVFAATASNARLAVDGLALFGVLRIDTPEDRARAVRHWVILLPAISVLLFLLWEKPVTLVFVGSIAQGFLLPFLAAAALYFRHRRTPEPLKPGTAWTLGLWIAALSMVAAGIYEIYSALRGRAH